MQRNRRVLHLTRNFRGPDTTDGFGSTNVFESLLDRGWAGEVRFNFVDDRDAWAARDPRFTIDLIDEAEFGALDVDLIVLEGGVDPLDWNQWRIPPALLTDFVESGGVAFAIDVDKGRLKTIDQRKDMRFFGAHVDPEGTVPYLADGVGTVFDVDPQDMLVSPWLLPAFAGIANVHVRAAVPVQHLADISISSSPRARQLRDDLYEPGMGPFPIGTVINHQKGYAAGIFAHMTTDYLTDEYPDNTRWITNLIEIVTEEAARRTRLLTSGIDKKAPSRTGLVNLIAGGESQSVEFKTSLGWNAPRPDPKDHKATRDHEDQLHQVVKSVAGFMNAEGGTLIIGVTDDGTIVGIEQDLARYKSEDELVRAATAKISGSLGDQSHNVHVAIETVDERSVVVFRTNPARRPAYASDLSGRFKGKEVFWVRRNNQTEEFEGRQLVNYIRDRFPAI